jgi:hypothetical protein
LVQVAQQVSMALLPEPTVKTQYSQQLPRQVAAAAVEQMPTALLQVVQVVVKEYQVVEVTQVLLVPIIKATQVVTTQPHQTLVQVVVEQAQ